MELQHKGIEIKGTPSEIAELLRAWDHPPIVEEQPVIVQGHPIAVKNHTTTQKYQPWTTPQDDKIRAVLDKGSFRGLWGRQQLELLMRELGRTRYGILSRAHKLRNRRVE